MKKLALLPLLLICIISKPLLVNAQSINVGDSIALVNFFDSTNGNGWNNHSFWRTPYPVSQWQGVTVKNGRVTSIKLNVNNITGVLPASLGNLTALTYLSLYSNKLADTLPVSFVNLINLTYLDLSNNNLNGPLPSFLGSMPALQTIDLYHNAFTGSIPASLANLTHLNSLVLSVNNLSGNIPPELGSIASLASLILSGNKLTGNIPPELGNLHFLQTLVLSSNLLTGEIPASLGNLTNMLGIDLSNCMLTGSVPAGINNMKLLSSLYLQNNQLSGTIPDLSNLKRCVIYTYNNRFTFSGFEQYPLIRPNSWTKYTPQASIPLIQNGNNLSVAAGGTLTNDTFRLYKNNVLVATQVGDSLFTITETGKYFIATRNSVAVKLTLYSDTVNISSLPLSMLGFAATAKNTGVALQWQTANEVNTSRFIVQRSSNGAFTTIGTVDAANANTNHTNNYNFTDIAPLQGDNMYRLKMVDKDGAFTYSKTVSVKYSGPAGGLSVYPNIVRSNATVNFTTAAGKYTITISNSNGGRVKQIAGFASQGTNSTQVDMSTLAKGVYIVTLTTGEGKNSAKVVKE